MVKIATTLTAVILSTSMLGGCASYNPRANSTGKNVGVGAGVGAVGGAVLGQVLGGDTGATVLGATVGAVVGGGAGYLASEDDKPPAQANTPKSQKSTKKR